ncbi:tetratricopeptide repeat protein [Shewanella maritima]|uniref:tetratricopeptide repeat protein n=1 Tax=Shewanella maritima TaxID=2520507 RepID=UPI00373562D0
MFSYDFQYSQCITIDYFKQGLQFYLRLPSAFLLLFLSLIALTGCSSTDNKSTVEVDLQKLFIDSAFEPQQIIPPEDVFKLSADFKKVVQRDYQAALRSHKNGFSANKWLANYVGAQDGGFEYRDHLTRPAYITEQSRQGNCMSLVVLSAALADEFGIPVKFQDIEVEPVWDKRGGFYLVNGHVNVKMMPRNEMNTVLFSSNEIVVDFLPERAMRAFKQKVVSRQTLLAMYYNNVAAESLVVGDYHQAYALVKQGILIDPSYTPGINTLAVIYRHNNMPEQAELVYRQALNQSPDDLSTLFNLALILGEQGRLKEWAEVHKVLELARINNPFYYYDMAQQAYFEQQYQEALVWYKRAVEKADYRHEFYFGLSRAYWATGEERLAKKNMVKALDLTRDDESKLRYQTKLNAMKSY